MTIRVTFFAGKGGVGKTTCAAGYAVALAARGTDVLLLSTDPAHSLGDALGTSLSATPKRVRTAGGSRRGALRAAELDAPRAFGRWLTAHRHALGEAIEHGTWLDRSDIDALLDLSLPGIDELMALLEIVRLGRATPSPAAVVVDTAPTGHTLRLLAAPRAVAGASDALDALQAEHRVIRQQLARVSRPEAADRLIALVADQASEAASLLDASRSSFRWVALAEDLSLAETADGVAALNEARVRIDEIIVNRVVGGAASCPVCDRLRDHQAATLARFRRQFGSRSPIRLVAAAAIEPRGHAALARFGEALLDRRGVHVGAMPAPRAARKRRHPGVAYSAGRGPGVRPEELATEGTRLLLVGGKGGVGKTTVAATVALRVARANPRVHVLLMSADPAHSIGDVIGAAVGDVPVAIRGGAANLHVREIDAAGLLIARRAQIKQAVDEIVAATGADDGHGVDELMQLAPPGIDELLAMIEVANLLDPKAAGGRDVIVVDMAPTGHALRLLQMPGTAHAWVRVLLRLLLKYRAVVRPGRLAQELVELSQSIGRLQTILHDPAQTRFIVVTRAADLPLRETERLFRDLGRLRIGAPVLVVNAVTLDPGACPRCRAVAASERRLGSRMTRVAGARRRHRAVVAAPLAAPPPRGPKELERWGAEWKRI